jgi:3-hydroxyisobutyrate dehydrogenase
MARIAFIGLGNMGAPMAANLIAAGHEVAGFDLSAAAVAALAAAGGRAAGAVAEALSGAAVVITMLPAGDHVRSVYLGDDGVIARAAAATLLIDCSTIDVHTAREMHGAAADRDLAMLDAPVSGGVAGAEAGTLTFMVGGDDAAVERARPILEAMGRNIIHAGDAGTGQGAKMCNNLILGISMIAVAEAFTLAEAVGLEAQRMFDIVSTSSGQCWSLTVNCPVPGPVPKSPANRDYAPGFTAAMMLKDLRLATAAAARTEIATPLGDDAAALYAHYCDSGGAGRDFSGIIGMIAAMDRG